MPGPGQVDVWAAVPEAVEAEALEALACALPTDERERAAGFLLESARRRFVVTRSLLRRSLSTYAEVPPEAWRFARGPHDKPFITGPQAALGLCFNVSHTAGLAVCAIALSEVGIDVQETTRPPPMRALERYLTETERGELRRLPPSERAERSWAYWTLKEAFAKALGLGLSLPFGQVGFALTPLAARDPRSGPVPVAACRGPSGPDACVATPWLGPGCPHDGRRIRMKTWRASPHHQLSLALSHPERVATLPHAADGEPWPRVCIRGSGDDRHAVG